MYEISGEMERRKLEEERHRNKLNEILLALNNNCIGESLVQKSGFKD